MPVHPILYFCEVSPSKPTGRGHRAADWLLLLAAHASAGGDPDRPARPARVRVAFRITALGWGLPAPLALWQAAAESQPIRGDRVSSTLGESRWILSGLLG